MSSLASRAPKELRFGERLSRSLEYLSFKARSHSATVSYELIENVLSEQRKYALFREMFPNEWKRSRASVYRRGYYCRYSERTNEFFQLVNEKCFPLLESAYDDTESEFEQFAIPPMNVDLCCEEIYFENLRVSYAAALIFYVPDEAWDFLASRFRLSRSDFPEISTDPHPNVWDTQSNSLFAELLRLVDHSTGNPWLDNNYCQNVDWYTWDRETIEELTSEFRAANEMFERLGPLDDQIEAEPKKMLSALIEFWNRGEYPNLMLPATGVKKDV